jgi:hypothetical protein
MFFEKISRAAAAILATGAVALTLGGATSAGATTLAPLALTELQLNTGNWSAGAGFGSVTPGSFVDGDFVTHLQGAVKQISTAGPNPDLIGTIEGFGRPSHYVYTLVHTFDGTYADLSVAPNGQVSLIDPRPPALEDHSFVSLDGVNFATEPGTSIAVNAANWSASAGFGSVPPAYYSDASATIVHLEGAARQTSTTGPNPDLLAILPAQARPLHDVYTIVHTFNGTYADLAIDSDGSVRLISPRPPAVQDYNFVSLEGITYQAGPGIPARSVKLNSADWSGTAGNGAVAPSWYKDGFGIVHLQGAAKQINTSGNANLLGVLPRQARPNYDVYMVVHTLAGTYADLNISPNGQIDLIDPRPPAVKDYSFVSLEGLTFQQAPPFAVKPISLNTANWSANAGFEASAPGWYQDGYGIVHLQGAAKQVSSAGTNPDVLGTLPVAARPSRNVFTVVHTFNGSFADLAIETNGQIAVIGPRFPAVQDFSFLSLESISYQPANANPVTAIPVNTANWSASAGFGSSGPAWYDTSGTVHLQGAVAQVSSSGPNSNLIGTLPAGVSPGYNVFTIVHTFDGTYADIAIGSDGTIRLISPRPPAVQDYTFVSLEGVQFQIGGSFNPNDNIPVNIANWSILAGFGSRSPYWYRDNSFIVHLEGAVTQISTTGTNPNLIGTLPADVAPTRAVYTIVHTFNGTYADLAIEPNGQILVIAPRAPAVRDYTFVSLEGITYQQ